jgi:hypothetical protein
MAIKPDFTRPIGIKELTQYSTKIVPSNSPDIEDIIQEAEICIRDAYYRGYEEGAKINNLSFITKGDLLRAFDSYANKYVRLTGDEEGPVFVPRRPEGIRLGITLDTLIKNFLLSYDDE